MLTFPLATPSATPPKKRAKVASPLPGSLAERLAAASYTNFPALLADVVTACKGAQGNADGEDRARVLLFRKLATDLVNRERVKRAHLFDFVEEWEGTAEEEWPADLTTATLTVMGANGPLFSSLPAPERIVLHPRTASSENSRASSTTGASPSTAATSVPDDSVDEISIRTPLPEFVLPPQVSLAQCLKPQRGEGRVPTIGDSFPPPPGLPQLTAPTPTTDESRPVKMGLQWGGTYGPGGVRVDRGTETKSEPAGAWLRYRNHPDFVKTWPHEPFRMGIGLPPEFVACFSSFAPTHDNSAAKVPAAVRSAVWWNHKGRDRARRLFADDPVLAHVFGPREPELDEDELRDAVESFRDDMVDPALRPDASNTIPAKAATSPEKDEDTEMADAEAEEEAEDDSDDDADSNADSDADSNADAESATDKAEVSTSTAKTAAAAPPSDPTAVLQELATLLSKLRSQQYARLLTTSPGAPTSAEQATYDTLTERFSVLLNTLPPHHVTTVDGDPYGALTVSKKIPLLAPCAPVPGPGMLPSDRPSSPTTLTVSTSTGASSSTNTTTSATTATAGANGQQLPGAAMAAMNAAAGLSPVATSNAPVAAMAPTSAPTSAPATQPPPYATPARNGGSAATGGAATAAAKMGRQGSYSVYANYPQPPGSAPAAQRSGRSTVPPGGPQGLAAAGVGVQTRQVAGATPSRRR